MINITGVVTGEKNVQARFERTSPRVRESLTREVLRVVIDLQGYVARNKLAGQLLKRRTGTLAASIQHRVVSTTSSVTGAVGSRINESAPLSYARIHEDGFDGTVTVREHLRMMTTAFGHPVKNPRKITVGAHTAQRHVRAKHYLSGSLAERRDQYLAQLDRAVGAGLK